MISYMKSYDAWERDPDGVCYIPENNEGDPDDCYTKNDFINLCDGDEIKAKIVFDLCSWEHPECILDQWDEEDEEDLLELKERYDEHQ